MARALNQKIIENLRPDPAKRLEIPDGALVGLYLVLQPSGARSWAVRYRADGKPRKLTLAPFPRMGLADARKAAGEALRIVSEAATRLATGSPWSSSKAWSGRRTATASSRFWSGS